MRGNDELSSTFKTANGTGGSHCLVGGAEGIRTVGPLCAPYIQGNLVTREISTRSFQKTAQRSFLRRHLSALPCRKRAGFELSLRRNNYTFSRMGLAVRIPFAPATRHCEPMSASECHSADAGSSSSLTPTLAEAVRAPGPRRRSRVRSSTSRPEVSGKSQSRTPKPGISSET